MDWQQQVKGEKVASVIYTEDEILQRRIETVCDGLLPNVVILFVELSEPNKRAITDFILDLIKSLFEKSSCPVRYPCTRKM